VARVAATGHPADLAVGDPTTPATAAPPARPKPAWQVWAVRIWRPARFVIGIGLGALALYALNGQKGELVDATAELGRLHTSWLVVGIVAELVSLAAFAGLQTWLLRVGGVHIVLLRMLGITLGAGAIASSMPAGPAVSSVFAFRQYRRGGADDALAAWTLVATLTCASLALAALATGGVLVAEPQGASQDLIGVTIGVLVVAVLATVVVWQRRWLVTVASGAIGLCQRVTGRPRREGAEIVQLVLDRLQTVHFGFPDIAGALGWALANWVLDCGCLVCSFLAVGAGVPWRGLLLAYGAGQLAANLPITPGGLGVVEGSLTIALVQYGGNEASTVAAVLLYRIISFWGFLPVGWAAWGGVTWSNRRHDRKAALAGLPRLPPHEGHEGGAP
jgi:uncharacterized membrane protein YbhN (UPF0104 family)